jgi:peptidoglycan/LPS O-acetylase OafA/YrhL
MFFALSGFLVAGSLTRTPQLTKFLGLRALRIYPALIADTLLAAFLLGPALTTLPLSDYFRAHDLHHYMLNCLGIIHYNLPGVFASNPSPYVINRQLWTVPYELQCYIVLSFLAFLGVFQRRYVILSLSILFQLSIFVWAVISEHGHFNLSLGPVRGSALVMVFLAGVTLYALREKVILNFWLFIAAIGVTVVGFSVPLGEYFISYPVAYMTVYLGFQNPRANFLHKLGDLSYGIYLYGFPLQQVVASVSWARHWYISFPLSLALSIIVAAISWNVVEKPALTLKRHLALLKPADALLDGIKATVRSGMLRLSRA